MITKQNVKKKINKNLKLCPLCGSSKKNLLYKSTLNEDKPGSSHYTCTTISYGIHGPIYKCLDCDFAFIDDNKLSSAIVDNYEDVEDPLYISEEAARIKTFKRHLEKINRLFRKKGKMLEVGAYTGLFLSLARNSGWSVDGIEPSKWAVSKAKERYDIKIKQGIMKPGYFSKNEFDVIAMWDVIEHVPNPLRDLRTCYSYLKPGGYMVMSTVDIGSFISKILGRKWPWLMDMHRVYFSRSTIKKMLEKASFTNILFRPHIRFVSIRYLASRFMPIGALNSLPFGKIIIPFYVGDLFEVTAQKPEK